MSAGVEDVLERLRATIAGRGVPDASVTPPLPQPERERLLSHLQVLLHQDVPAPFSELHRLVGGLDLMCVGTGYYLASLVDVVRTLEKHDSIMELRTDEGTWPVLYVGETGGGEGYYLDLRASSEVVWILPTTSADEGHMYDARTWDQWWSPNLFAGSLEAWLVRAFQDLKEAGW